MEWYSINLIAPHSLILLASVRLVVCRLNSNSIQSVVNIQCVCVVVLVSSAVHVLFAPVPVQPSEVSVILAE